MTSALLYLDPRDLTPDPRNTRSNPGDLAGLADTIRDHGLLQPIGVLPHNGGYQVVYGNRRREAAIAAGLDRVPCLVLEDKRDGDVLMMQLLENLQRLDLGDMDKARAFRRALEAEEQTPPGEKAVDVLAHRLGLSVRQIQRYLGLLDLPPGVQLLVEMGELGVTHAQHLRSVASPERQMAVAELAVEESLSAVELSRLCRALSSNPNISPAEALARVRAGEEVADVSVRPRSTTPSHLPPPPPAKAEESEKDEYEDEGNLEESDDAVEWDPTAKGAAADPSTRDGNRVHKFHSVDSFVDEVDRLVLCVQEGDLTRLAKADPEAAVKLGLAARQIRYLAERLAGLL